jgi:SAM-dependent methyltransferase
MVKYVLSAAALKCFSAGPQMRGLYRGLGNMAGGRRRGTGPIPSYYPERIKRMLRLQEEYHLVQSGDRIIELGTGWLHWDALTIRLFFDVQAVLFDVWDNRQLSGLKNYVTQLSPILQAEGFGLSATMLARAQSLIAAIKKVDSLEDLYKLLGFEYVVQSSGSLRQFPRNSFQLVVSGGVLEHVDRNAVPVLLAETFDILKPGGWALHSIDIQDHLSYYDSAVSKKEYLAFSEGIWRHIFENKVQYINRLQRSEWLDLFEAVGFESIDEDSWKVDISQLRVAQRFAKMEKSDLECGGVKVLFNKASH